MLTTFTCVHCKSDQKMKCTWWLWELALCIAARAQSRTWCVLELSRALVRCPARAGHEISLLYGLHEWMNEHTGHWSMLDILLFWGGGNQKSSSGILFPFVPPVGQCMLLCSLKPQNTPCCPLGRFAGVWPFTPHCTNELLSARAEEVWKMLLRACLRSWTP